MPGLLQQQALFPGGCVSYAGHCAPSVWQVVRRAAAGRFCGRRASARGVEQLWASIPGCACSLPLRADAIGILPSIAKHHTCQLTAKQNHRSRVSFCSWPSAAAALGREGTLICCLPGTVFFPVRTFQLHTTVHSQPCRHGVLFMTRQTFLLIAVCARRIQRGSCTGCMRVCMRTILPGFHRQPLRLRTRQWTLREPTYCMPCGHKALHRAPIPSLLMRLASWWASIPSACPSSLSYHANSGCSERLCEICGSLYLYTQDMCITLNRVLPCVQGLWLQAGQHIKGQEERRQSYDTVSCLLSILKNEFRDRKTRYTVHSVTLLGTDSLRGLLHNANR